MFARCDMSETTTFADAATFSAETVIFSVIVGGFGILALYAWFYSTSDLVAVAPHSSTPYTTPSGSEPTLIGPLIPTPCDGTLHPRHLSPGGPSLTCTPAPIVSTIAPLEISSPTPPSARAPPTQSFIRHGRRPQNVAFLHQPVDSVARFHKDQPIDVQWQDESLSQHLPIREKSEPRYIGGTVLASVKELNDTDSLIDVLTNAEALVEMDIGSHSGLEIGGELRKGLHVEVKGSVNPDLDVWIEPWGRVPTKMVEICDRFIEGDVIDFGKLASALKSTRSTESLAYPFKTFFLDNTCSKDQKNITSWNDDRWNRTMSQESKRNLLLGYFMASFRGWTGRDLWIDKAGKADKEIAQLPAETDVNEIILKNRLSSAVYDALDKRGRLLVLWLEWMGGRWQLQRMFTAAGAELLDGSARISVRQVVEMVTNSGQVEQKHHGFRVDITLFTPGWFRELPKYMTLTGLEGIPVRDHKSWTFHDRRQGRLKKTLNVVFNAARSYIEEYFPQEGDLSSINPLPAPQHVDDSFARRAHLAGANKHRATDRFLPESDFRIPRTLTRRLILRPGLTSEVVTQFNNPEGTTDPGQFKMMAFERKARMANINLHQFKPYIGYNNELAQVHDAVGDLINIFRPDQISFSNRRQYNWLAPRPGLPAGLLRVLESYNCFDENTLSVMLSALQYASDKICGAPQSSSHHGGQVCALSQGYARWGEMVLDMGGFMPVVENEQKSLSTGIHTFPWLKTIHLATHVWIPLWADEVQANPEIGMPEVLERCTGAYILSPSYGIWDVLGSLKENKKLTVLVDCPRSITVGGATVVKTASLGQGRQMLQEQLDLYLPRLLYHMLDGRPLIDCRAELNATGRTIIGEQVHKIVTAVNRGITLALSEQLGPERLDLPWYHLQWLWESSRPDNPYTGPVRDPTVYDAIEKAYGRYQGMRLTNDGNEVFVAMALTSQPTGDDEPVIGNQRSVSPVDLQSVHNCQAVLPSRGAEGWKDEILAYIDSDHSRNSEELKRRLAADDQIGDAHHWYDDAQAGLEASVPKYMASKLLAKHHELDTQSHRQAQDVYLSEIAESAAKYAAALQSIYEAYLNARNTVGPTQKQEQDIVGWEGAVSRIIRSEIDVAKSELRFLDGEGDTAHRRKEMEGWLSDRKAALEGKLLDTLLHEALAKRFRIDPKNLPTLRRVVGPRCMSVFRSAIAFLEQDCNEWIVKGGVSGQRPDAQGWRDEMVDLVSTRIKEKHAQFAARLAATLRCLDNSYSDTENSKWLQDETIRLRSFVTFIMSLRSRASCHGLNDEKHNAAQRELRPTIDESVDRALAALEKLHAERDIVKETDRSREYAVPGNFPSEEIDTSRKLIQPHAPGATDSVIRVWTDHFIEDVKCQLSQLTVELASRIEKLHLTPHDLSYQHETHDWLVRQTEGFPQWCKDRIRRERLASRLVLPEASWLDVEKSVTRKVDDVTRQKYQQLWDMWKQYQHEYTGVEESRRMTPGVPNDRDKYSDWTEDAKVRVEKHVDQFITGFESRLRASHHLSADHEHESSYVTKAMAALRAGNGHVLLEKSQGFTRREVGDFVREMNSSTGEKSWLAGLEEDCEGMMRHMFRSSVEGVETASQSADLGGLRVGKRDQSPAEPPAGNIRNVATHKDLKSASPEDKWLMAVSMAMDHVGRELTARVQQGWIRHDSTDAPQLLLDEFVLELEERFDRILQDQNLARSCALSPPAHSQLNTLFAEHRHQYQSTLVGKIGDLKNSITREYNRAFPVA